LLCRGLLPIFFFLLLFFSASFFFPSLLTAPKQRLSFVAGAYCLFFFLQLYGSPYTTAYPRFTAYSRFTFIYALFFFVNVPAGEAAALEALLVRVQQEQEHLCGRRALD
jgi:hypothetical protein